MRLPWQPLPAPVPQELVDKVLARRVAVAKILGRIEDVWDKSAARRRARFEEFSNAVRIGLTLLVPVTLIYLVSRFAWDLANIESFDWLVEFAKWPEPLQTAVFGFFIASMVLLIVQGFCFVYGVGGKESERYLALATALRKERASLNRLRKYGRTEFRRQLAGIDTQVLRIEQLSATGQGDLDHLFGRMKSAAEKMLQSARANLVFGVVISIVAVALVLGAPLMKFAGVQPGLTEIAIRVGLGVTAQSVGFFFLLGYRRGLTEWKFFVNEMSTIQAKLYSLSKATELIASSDGRAKEIFEVLVSRTLESIGRLDRNRHVPNGGTTPGAIERTIDLKELDIWLGYLGGGPKPPGTAQPGVG